MLTEPLLSVVMAVHNGEDYLRQAIESVLNQTYRHFEFIVINDGSIDRTASILEGYSDSKLRIISIPASGLPTALNIGLAASKGKYIARMDADDISFPNRFECQVDYLENHPEISIVCSDIITINSKDDQIGSVIYYGLTNEILVEGLTYRRNIKPVVHPSVMMRRNVYESVGGYRNYFSAEDHDYWLRCVGEFRFVRQNQFLLKYRIHEKSTSVIRQQQQIVSSLLAVVNYLFYKKFKIDLYVERPDVLQGLAKIALERYKKGIGDSANDYAVFRDAVRRKSYIYAFIMLAYCLYEHGVSFFPRLDLFNKKILTEILVTEAKDLFNA